MDDENQPILTDEDFYPPEDNRTIRSGIRNIGDYNFNDYLIDYFELCDCEESYD